jgi:predicted MFS family arabinose efflux permease
MSTPASPAAAFTGYQRFIIAVIAFLQFTIILDFMILSPLGALLMRDLHVPASRFGLVMSVYAFSAGISGLLAAGFADRFDRKRLLMFFYVGFVVGTLLCGLAPSYHFLLAARMVTGLFGGVVGSVCLAIVADLFPLEMRGRVMGYVQTAFAASQVLGIPLGLYLSNYWGWHAPFLLIVAVSSVVGVVIALHVRPITGHLALQRRGGALGHLGQALRLPRYLRAYSATTMLVTGGFMIMPFGSAFTVNNLGISLQRLPLVYMVTGLCSIFLGPMAGRLSDRIGKYAVFTIGSLLSMVMVVVFTHLGVTPLVSVILVNVLLMAGISARMVSASALTSAVPEAADRGAFMSINSSVQQFSGGIAAGVAGLIVSQDPQGRLQHYDTLGFVVCGTMAVAITILYFINREVMARRAAAAARPPVAASA